MLRLLSLMLLIFTVFTCVSDNIGDNNNTNETSDVDYITKVGNSVVINPGDTLTDIENNGAVIIKYSKYTFAIGYKQTTSINKDPVVVMFDGDEQKWYRDDYEITGTDGEGTGLISDGENRLYASFTVDGTQGTATEDFRRFAENGWLKSATDKSTGWGGGKISVIVKLDPDTGDGLFASFITAKKQDGKTNSVNVKKLELFSENITAYCNSWWSPRDKDYEPFTVEGSSPFGYTLTFNEELTAVLSASWQEEGY